MPRHAATLQVQSLASLTFTVAVVMHLGAHRLKGRLHIVHIGNEEEWDDQTWF